MPFWGDMLVPWWVLFLVFLGLIISANLDLFLRVVFRIFWIAGNLRHGLMGQREVIRGKNKRLGIAVSPKFVRNRLVWNMGVYIYI